MKAKELQQKVAELLSEGRCGASLVLAGFSSIYACRGDLRLERKRDDKDERNIGRSEYGTKKCYLGIDSCM